MKVEYVEETSVRKALTFEIEPEVVEKEIQARAREYARKVRLPGFRAGKVPPAVVRQRFRGTVVEEAAEALVNRVVPPELEGRGLKPLGSPKVTELKLEDNAPMTFRVVFETLPFVEVPDYRDLPAKARQPRVAEEEVDKHVERLRAEAARYDPVEGRPAQEGDFALVDLEWRPLDGGRGGRQENALIEVGGQETAAEIRAALLGASAGETRSATVARAGDDPAQPPRRILYTLQLKAVKTRVVPPADDDFAKDLGDFETLAELRSDVRRRLLAEDERRAEREVKDALVEALVQRASFEVPETLVERNMNARTEQAARALALRGVDPGKLEMDWRAFREAQREEAVKAAKAGILLDEIARREGVEALEAEVEAELARYAQAMRKSKEAVRAQMERDGEIAALRARIREEKTLDLLKANARLDFE